MACTAATRAPSGTSPWLAMNRAARSMRKGSSPNETAGSSGVRSTLAARVVAPAVRVDQGAVGGVDGHGVDGEVATGKVTDHVVAEGDHGLARVRLIALGAVGGDLEGPPVHDASDGAESLALGPQRRGHSADDQPHCRRSGVGCAVEIGSGSEATGDSLTHNSAHQEQPIPGSIEEPLQAGRSRQRGRERVAGLCPHCTSSPAARRAAARTTSMPGPVLLAGSGRKSRPSNAPATA